MKNYLKISVAICLYYLSGNIYCCENNICSLQQFCDESNNKSLKTFFGNCYNANFNLNFNRCNNQELGKILELSNSTEYGINIADNMTFQKLVIKDNITMFLRANSTLSMGTRGIVDIQNGKVIITGKLKIEPGCIINIGDTKNNNENIESYLIINSNTVDLHNITINLNNANSHLEIHGNDISISNCKFNRVNKKATLHIYNKMINNFYPA